MSTLLQQQAERVAENCRKIILTEILRERFQAGGGTIELIDAMPETALTPTAQQKQALLAQQAAWKQAVKDDTAGW